MRRLSRRSALALGAALTLSALAARPAAAADFAPPEYADPHPLVLTVEAISVEDNSPPTGDPMHVESRMVVRPGAAIDRWAHDRLYAAGGPYRAIVVIRQASMVGERMATTPGVAGWLRAEDAERYTARLQVELRLVGRDGRKVGEILTESQQAGTLGKGADEADREVLWHDLLNRALVAIDNNIRQNARASLRTYVR